MLVLLKTASGGVMEGQGWAVEPASTGAHPAPSHHMPGE